MRVTSSSERAGAAWSAAPTGGRHWIRPADARRVLRHGLSAGARQGRCRSRPPANVGSLTSDDDCARCRTLSCPGVIPRSAAGPLDPRLDMLIFTCTVGARVVNLSPVPRGGGHRSGPTRLGIR